MRRIAVSVRPRSATAIAADRGVIRSLCVAGRLVIPTYSTEVALTEPTPPAGPAAAAPDLAREVDLDYRSVLAFLAAFVALKAFTGVIREVPKTTAALAIAGIVALAVNPLIDRAQARLRSKRKLAVVVVLFLIALAFTAIMALILPPALRQARQLGTQLPRVSRQLGNLPIIGDRLVRADVPNKLERAINTLPDRLAGNSSPLERAARHVADGILAGIVTALFAVTLMLDGPRLIGAARRLVPVRRRADADELGRLAYDMIGRYVAGSLLVALVAGLVILVAGLSLHIPLTPLAATWAMLWDLVPQIGGAAGGIPFVLLGLTRGAGTAAICLVVFIAYQQLKHQVLQPILIGQAVKLSPPTTMIAALVGVSAGGVVGAVLAVPLVGAAKAVYLQLRSRESHVTV